MQFSLHASRRSASGGADEAIDAEAIIARALNRPLNRPVNEPADSAQPAESPPQPAATFTAHVALRSPLEDDDPLMSELRQLGNSLTYDLWFAVGPLGWTDIVVELGPEADAEIAVRFDDGWRDWEPSGHSLRVLEGCREILAESYPAAGHDIVVTHRDVSLCQWPARAWDAVPGQHLVAEPGS